MDQASVLALRQVIGKIARELNSSAANEGLTPSEASVLGLVVAHRELGLSELAALEGLNPTMLSRVVRRLSTLGLVDRIADPDDLRSARIRSLPPGKRVHERIKRQRIAIVTECVNRLGQASVDAIIAALPALEQFQQELVDRRTGARAN